MPRPTPPSSPASPAPRFTALLASAGSPSERPRASSPSSSQLSKGVWSEEEHARFLDALKRFPQGPWKAITAHVATRSIRQVQTHAQKYMEKVERRARGLKTAQPRLVRRDHKIDDDVEAWWKRENGMLAGSPSRPKTTPRRRRRHDRPNSEDAAESMAGGSASATEAARDEYDDYDDDEGLDFEPLPLSEELAPASPLPTLEECLAVVNECLVDPMSSLQLEQSTIV